MLNKTAPTLVYDHAVQLAQLDGNAAAAGYLLLFNQATAPVANDVPVAVIQITAAGPFQSFSPESPQTFTIGLGIAMSSTANLLTVAATSHSYWGSVEDWHFNPADEAGVTVTDVNYPSPATGVLQTFWSNPNSAQARLVHAKAVNAIAAIRYLMLFATANPADGAVPITVWPIAASATKHLHFGSDGQDVFFYTVAGTKQSGCTLVWSTTATTLTRSVAEAHTITGSYRYNT